MYCFSAPLAPLLTVQTKTSVSLTVIWSPADIYAVTGYVLQFKDKDGNCVQGVRFWRNGGVKPDFPAVCSK